MHWHRFFVGLSLAVTVILAWSLVWGGQGLKAYNDLKAQHEFLEGRIVELDSRSIALSKEIRLLQSDAKYQEKVIRKRFNFVRDNEILYLFPGSHDTAKTGAAVHETKD